MLYQKNLFLKILQYSQKKTLALESHFNIVADFQEIFQNICFEEHLRTVASGNTPEHILFQSKIPYAFSKPALLITIVFWEKNFDTSYSKCVI